MVINLNVNMMFKIRSNLFLLPLAGILLMGCVTWPSFIIGDSSGYIQYDRNTRKLEVIWEKHLQVRDTLHIMSKADSIQDNTKKD